MEVGGSALFANVIPNRSHTNAITGAFGSFAHKSDNQKVAIVRCILQFSELLLSLEEKGGMPTAKVNTYPQSCGLLC